MFNKLLTVAALSASLLLSACQPIQPIAAPAAASPQPIVIEITADGFTMPEEMPSGPVTVTYKNNSDKAANPGFGWMVEGSTIADFEKAAKEGDFITFIKIATIANSVELAPGESKEATFHVQAGEVFVADVPDGAPPVIATSKATAASTMAAPTADYKVDMADFAFIMPDEIMAGKHLWEITNTGKQPHEMSIFKLNEGVTVEDVIKLMSSQEAPPDPPPFEQIPTEIFQSGGTTSWVTLDIPAGEYTVICGFPNLDDEAMSPHAAHGMVRQLVVK